VTTSDPSQKGAPTPAASSNSPPASTPAPDSAPASTPPASSPPASTPPASSPPASTPPSSKPPDSAPPSSAAPASSGDCAEIPAAAHAVLTTQIKLGVKVMFPVDQTSQFPHKLTLSNDDGSYSKTITLSASQAGDTDGTSVVTFADLTEGHTYTLQCDNGDGTDPYNLFENQPYDQIVDRTPDSSQDTTAPPSSPSLDASPDSDSDDGDGDAKDVLGFDDGDGAADPPASTPAPASQGGT
jgi:hypothetical protein